MGGICREGRYWDDLVKTCVSCDNICKEPHVRTRCIGYCESAQCKAQPGHYYDALVKNCVNCASVCGGHPAQCSQHCSKKTVETQIYQNDGKRRVWRREGTAHDPKHTTSSVKHGDEKSLPFTPKSPTPPGTTTKLLVGVTAHIPNSRGIPMPTDSILLYFLLVLCLGLLFSSLSLALAVLVRQTKAKNSKPRPKVANNNKECVVQSGQGVGRPWHNSKDFVTNSNRTPDHEPSYDSSPTETCVCVHCFPDLKALGQANDRSPKATFSYSPQPVLTRAQIQNGGPVWAEGNLYTSGQEVQEEAAVG